VRVREVEHQEEERDENLMTAARLFGARSRNQAGARAVAFAVTEVALFDRLAGARRSVIEKCADAQTRVMTRVLRVSQGPLSATKVQVRGPLGESSSLSPGAGASRGTLRRHVPPQGS